eukprot:TRINITY_DN11645_c0_g1_i1.p1 TRINITY_DN11645_c0_g1~~TRINITY_DN11645_c0_g1_i1.p1  ORF type:complete len:830 (+),score=177.25 TRINITY_DN11645_c0_g1_i1:105-2594(+)
MSFADSFLSQLNYDRSRISAQKMSSELWSQPQKQGGLLKKGHVRKNWKQRWFRLQDRNLFYFRTPEDLKPLAVLDLSTYFVGAVQIRDRPAGVLLKSGDGSGFKKDYLLSAPTDIERQDWITAFVKAGATQAAGPLHSVLLDDANRAASPPRAAGYAAQSSSSSSTDVHMITPTQTTPAVATTPVQPAQTQNVAPVQLLAPARKSTAVRRESQAFASSPLLNTAAQPTQTPVGLPPLSGGNGVSPGNQEAAMQKLSKDVLSVLYNEVDWTKAYSGPASRKNSVRSATPNSLTSSRPSASNPPPVGSAPTVLLSSSPPPFNAASTTGGSASSTPFNPVAFGQNAQQTPQQQQPVDAAATGQPVTAAPGWTRPQIAGRNGSPAPTRTVINTAASSLSGSQNGSSFAPPDGSVSSVRFSAATRARQSLADELLKNLDNEEFQQEFENEASNQTSPATEASSSSNATTPTPASTTAPASTGGWNTVKTRPNIDKAPAMVLGGRQNPVVPAQPLPQDPRERDKAEHRERLLAMKDQLVSKEDPLKFYECAPKAIGKGGVGEVFIGTKRDTGDKVAIKKLQTFFKGKDRLPMILNEVAVMASSAHANIVSYMGCHAVGTEELWVMMEYMDKGSLYDIVKMCIKLEEKSIAFIVREILQALAYIHERKRIHRDIKVDNVLISSRGHVKLADFGAAVQLTFQRMKRQTMTGTPYYMSPEVIAGKPYDEMVDIWSTGILCIELAELAPPYYDLSPEQALDKIVKEGGKGLPAGRKYSPDFIDFVNSRCLQYDPSRRTPAAQLLQHPFIKKSCTRQEFASTMASWTDFEVDSGGGCNIL